LVVEVPPTRLAVPDLADSDRPAVDAEPAEAASPAVIVLDRLLIADPGAEPLPVAPGEDAAA
jgi:hypothetical protein